MSESQTLKKCKILVVDDQEENRFYLETMLKGLGYEPFSVSNGKEALEILEKVDFGIIVSDILMPVMDGYQFCMEVRFNDNYNHIPFVFYTATYIDPKDEEFALALGADHFLRKPMDPAEFAKKIKEIIEDVCKNGFKAKKPQLEKEEQIFKLYNERLVKKLNKKMQDLEREINLRMEIERELKASEEKYRSLIEQASDSIFTMDSNLIIDNVNTSTCFMLNYPKEELIGMNFIDLIQEEKDRTLPFRIEEILSGKILVFELILKRKDGTKLPVEISAKLLKDGKIQGIARDITLRKKAEEALKESEERYALSVKGANDGLWDWNLLKGTIYFSPRWKEMLGYTEEEISNNPEEWFSLVHPDDIEMLKAELQAHLDGLKPHFEAEHRILHKNQTYRWVITRGLAIRDKENIPTRMAGSQTDITERKRAEEQILHDAFHDSVTGLPNRALFEDRLNQALNRLKRSKDFCFSVLHLNLDRFKIINETLGHALGNRVLLLVAEKIKRILKPIDTIARFSADEFLILLEDVKDAGKATKIAQRIISELEHPINLEGNEVFLSASIGIIMSMKELDRPEDYLRDAHIAMHKAKAKGRGNCAIFNAEMYEKTMENLRIESAIRRALERNEFCVYYQPIFDLSKDCVVGFEALVRWKHPEKGLLHPINFLSIAEEAGFISGIDQYVLKTSCNHFKKWLDINPSLEKLYVSVNFSSREFSNPNLISYVAQTLKDVRLEPKNLIVEITESTLMENISSAQAIFFQLQNLGIKLFLDDFGTGYSSLNYLQHFLIDSLKIDRSFVGQMAKEHLKSPIVHTIISLAHTMGMQALAEGVETQIQYSKLKDLNCNCAQGFYFSHPLKPEEVEEKIVKNKLG